jgi:hypothetical protein
MLSPLRRAAAITFQGHPEAVHAVPVGGHLEQLAAVSCDNVIIMKNNNIDNNKCLS